jgi:hypothetical protein
MTARDNATVTKYETQMPATGGGAALLLEVSIDGAWYVPCSTVVNY